MVLKQVLMRRRRVLDPAVITLKQGSERSIEMAIGGGLGDKRAAPPEVFPLEVGEGGQPGEFVKTESWSHNIRRSPSIGDASLMIEIGSVS